MQGTLEGFIDRLQQAATLEDLQAEAEALRDALGIEHILYHWVQSAGTQHGVGTYSVDWAEHYIQHDYIRVDPVIAGCFRRFHPVDWKRLDWTGRAARNLLGEALGAGVGNQGFSVPIRGPNGQFALFTANDRATDDRWSTFTGEHVRGLILIGHYMNQKALEIDRGTDRSTVPNLSPREVDALTLLALGFSRAQAAENLQISEHTLRVYIESARFKLGAMNTTHAVARALTMGLLVV